MLASFHSENRRETERSLLLYKNFCTQRYSWSCNVSAPSVPKYSHNCVGDEITKGLNKMFS